MSRLEFHEEPHNFNNGRSHNDSCIYGDSSCMAAATNTGPE